MATEFQLNTSSFIISTCDDADIKQFLKTSVDNFFKELSLYIQENDDEGIVHYGNEQTMASLFVCGNTRRSEMITGVQEYGIFATKDGAVLKGRPDIFLKSGTNAIWIECKYQKNIHPLGEDHWDVPGWLAWDEANAFKQITTYYNAESDTVNKLYQKHYLMTLCFKLIKEDREQHISKVEDKLQSKAADKCARLWFYQVGFFPAELGKEGLEVYGTCKLVFPGTN